MPKRPHRSPAEEEDPTTITQMLGGVVGGGTAAAIGAALGPAGMVVGALAGAVGGWWAGRGVAEAAAEFGARADEHFRRLHRQHYADRCEYDVARSFYQLGHLARSNPDYQGRSFAEVEAELRRGWRADATGPFQSWDDVRPFVSRGYTDAPPT